MVDTTKPLASARSASPFVAPAKMLRATFDKGADVGRATDLAYLEPAPMSRAVRITIALGLAVTAKLLSAEAFG